MGVDLSQPPVRDIATLLELRLNQMRGDIASG